MDKTKLLNLSLDAGELMLKSGAETSRVEDTMKRILKYGASDSKAEVIALTTGLFASIHNFDCESISNIRRVSESSINLEKISKVNSLSRKFVEGKIDLDCAITELEQIKNSKKYSKNKIIFSYGISSAAFTIMFKGNFIDFIGSFIAGYILGFFIYFLQSKKVSYFLSSLLSGSIITIVTIIFNKIVPTSNYEYMIIGSIMPLVPGVAITTAIRDIMQGDFLSGTAKAMEAILVAVAVAGGVGIVLRIIFKIF